MEVLHRWKEKYRKHRETKAANAAMLSARLHGSACPYSPANSPQTSRIRDISYPMVSADCTSDYHSGRSLEEHAIAEALRMQYAGNTGLHKSGPLNAQGKHRLPSCEVLLEDLWNRLELLVCRSTQKSRAPTVVRPASRDCGLTC
ncbi:hypothetical protein BWQ96_04699 [Gracilariopsis chorda]|uniref:Uncharacterized protein n=1 Tax=Gracilariopsis chorda TaxID=448386 RepID=A0A2V3ITV8_9FLOR|nr:hypothetical protein BWQ96_04699 [Gracilariopsis chorda]|eukprot:PXF45561.1 hypothetical protein BWQ96_04699 [Gracilariopsis chorda]